MATRGPTKAYHNQGFLNSKDARALRMLAEYLEPKSRFDHHRVDDTVVFMGSARIRSREDAEELLRQAEAGHGDVDTARMALKMSAYYEAARELAARLTRWSKELDHEERRFVVCTGGGPGIMEAANRGASEAHGMNVGLTISIPQPEFDNPYVTRELSFHFHYFFMRKFWFAYLAKALVIFPGGFGTLDEMFEILTLMQTEKLTKQIQIILYGTDYWDRILDLDPMAEWGAIRPSDKQLLQRANSPADAFELLKAHLTTHHLTPATAQEMRAPGIAKTRS